MKKNNTRDYTIIVFFIMIYNSGNSILMNNIFLFLMAFILVVKTKLWESKSVGIMYVLIVFGLYFLVASVIHNDFPNKYDYTFIARHISYALIAFSVIKLMGLNFFFIFESIFYKLTVLSLIIFGLQLLFPDIIFTIISAGERLLGYTNYNPNRGIKYSSILVYTYNETISTFLPHRNCGYLYEPGYYSLHIVIALLISIVKSNLVINRKHILYIVALITTFSTTGYIAFIFLLAFYSFNIPQKGYRNLAIVASIPVVFYIVMLPVVYEKTMESFIGTQDLMAYAGSIVESGGHYSIGRFAGFIFAYLSIVDFSPIFGTFRTDTAITQGFIIVNGFGVLLISFGFLGLFLILFGLYKSSKLFIVDALGLKFPIFLFAIIVISNFGFIFQMSLIFWIFYFIFISEAKFNTFQFTSLN